MPHPVCPYAACDGFGSIYLPNPGSSAGSVSWCRCKYADKAAKHWQKTVGSHDQHVKLSDLVPSDKSKLPTNTQQKCIDVMKKNPADSYAMFGPSGTSKTTYTVALYRACLNDNYDNLRNTIRVKAKTLLETIQAFRFDDNFDSSTAAPFTTATRIRNVAAKGIKTHLFLEELEKVKYSEFKATELWDIIDAIYEEGGQLVISGNLTWADLNDTSKYMEGMPRRIEEVCPHLWDFWKYEKGKA